MSLNINEFIASLSDGGLLNPTRYQFSVSSPIGVIVGGRSMSMKCSKATWPGKTIETIDSDIGFGPIIKVPKREAHETMSLTFYSSKNLKEWGFWSEWMDHITGKKDFKLKQYADCVGFGQLDVIDEAGAVTATMNIISCYPTILGPIEFSYSAFNTIAEFTVDIEYYNAEFDVDSSYSIGNK